MILYKAKWAWLLLLYVHVFSSMKIQECMPMYHANFGEEIKEIKHFSLHNPPHKKKHPIQSIYMYFDLIFSILRQKITLLNSKHRQQSNKYIFFTFDLPTYQSIRQICPVECCWPPAPFVLGCWSPCSKGIW